MVKRKADEAAARQPTAKRQKKDEVAAAAAVAEPPPRDPRTKMPELKKGTWLSSVVYYKVNSIDDSIHGTSVGVENHLGHDLRISSRIIEDETFSSKQFSRTVKMTTTELAALLASVKDKVFTVCFIKKQTKERVAQAIENEDMTKLDTTKKLCKFAADKLLDGEKRELVGHLLHTDEENLGYIDVYDLEEKGPRKVNSRKILWLIVDDVKYENKKKKF